MKIKVTFKDPDFHVQTDFAHHPASDLGGLIDQFVKWGEYLTIEIDVTSRTARVVPTQEITT